MKTKTLLFLICLFLTGTSFAQTWGLNNTRTDTRNNAGEWGPNVMSGFYQTSNPTAGSYPTNATSWWHLLDVRHDAPII